MPTSAYLGAYHIMTEYLGVERVDAYKALTRTLETRSPAFYPDIAVDLAIDALAYANGYDVEAWDGYLIALAKGVGAPILYSIDKTLAKRAKGIEVINPIPGEKFEQYNRWLKERLRKPSIEKGADLSRGSRGDFSTP